MKHPYRPDLPPEDQDLKRPKEPWYGWIGFLIISLHILKWMVSLPRKIFRKVVDLALSWKWIFTWYFWVRILACAFNPISIVIHQLRLVGGQPKEKDTACKFATDAVNFIESDTLFGLLGGLLLCLWGFGVVMILGAFMLVTCNA